MYCNVHVLGEQSNRCKALSSYIAIVLPFPSYLQTQMFAPRNSSLHCTLQLVIYHEALTSTRRRKVHLKQSQPAVRWWSYCYRQTGRGWAASPLTSEPKTAKEWPRCTWHVQEAMYPQCRSWWLTLKVCTVCDFIMLTFLKNERNYHFFYNDGKTYAPAVQWNDRRALRFQTIQRANSMVTRVRLRSFQSPTNASVISPVSDRSVARKIVTFCNRSAVCRTVRITVKLFYKNGTKTEWNVNIIKSHTVSFILSLCVRDLMDPLNIAASVWSVDFHSHAISQLYFLFVSVQCNLMFIAQFWLEESAVNEIGFCTAI